MAIGKNKSSYGCGVIKENREKKQKEAKIYSNEVLSKQKETIKEVMNMHHNKLIKILSEMDGLKRLETRTIYIIDNLKREKRSLLEDKLKLLRNSKKFEKISEELKTIEKLFPIIEEIKEEYRGVFELNVRLIEDLSIKAQYIDEIQIIKKKGKMQNDK